MAITTPFSALYMEIVSTCNAKCPWCDTGMRKIGLLPKIKKGGNTFIDPEFFLKILLHLHTINIISKDTIVYPFNYGEPFLHPKLSLFIQILEELSQPYFFSTNASVVPILADKLRLTHLQGICFSMSGFSQNSYDRIHGFNFTTITSNITKTLKLFREKNFRGIAEIHYHQYKFNTDEINLAATFAFQNSMQIRINPAIPVAQEIVLDYLNNTLDPKIKEKMEEDMDLSIYRDALVLRPKDYICVPKRSLLISSSGKLLWCSWFAENHPDISLGNVLTMSANDIMMKLSTEHPLCKQCEKAGVDFFMTGWPFRKKIEPETIPTLPERKPFLTKDGVWLWLLDDDKYVSDNIKKDCYEKETMSFIANYIKKDDICIDIGANIGVFTTLMAKKIDKHGHVYAYEPSPIFYKILEHTVHQNNLKNVSIFQFGLSDKNKNAVLQQNTITGGQCFPSNNPPIRKDFIQLIPLDKHIMQMNVPHIDLIKIDVDGHDPYVLRGALETINKYNPVIIVELSHLHYFLEGVAAWDFYNWLQKQSFHIYCDNGQRIHSLQDFLVRCSNFNQVCNIILTRVPLDELKAIRKASPHTPLPIAKQNACSICDSEWFGAGPKGRTSENGTLPRCLRCNSLERHRAIRLVWNTILPHLTKGSAIQFSEDPSAPEDLFTSLEISCYNGSNSLDLQNICRADNSYQYVLCNHVLEHVEDDKKAFTELLRILNHDGLLVISFPDPLHKDNTIEFGYAVSEQHGHFRIYGADVWRKLKPHNAHILQVNTTDNTTNYKDTLFFVSKKQSIIEKLHTILTQDFTTFII